MLCRRRSTTPERTNKKITCTRKYSATMRSMTAVTERDEGLPSSLSYLVLVLPVLVREMRHVVDRSVICRLDLVPCEHDDADANRGQDDQQEGVLDQRLAGFPPLTAAQGSHGGYDANTGI